MKHLKIIHLSDLFVGIINQNLPFEENKWKDKQFLLFLSIIMTLVPEEISKLNYLWHRIAFISKLAVLSFLRIIWKLTS